MSYTSHGHHIPNTILEDKPEGMGTARCGGPRLCASCQHEALEMYMTRPPMGHILSPYNVSPNVKETPKMATELKPKKYIRRPFDVEAIQVTEDNFEEVAAWCGGKIVTIAETVTGGDTSEATSQKHISVEVARPLSRRQTEAYVGDWVLYASKGFKVYGNRPFAKNFTLKEESDIRDKTEHVDAYQETPQELMVTNEPAPDPIKVETSSPAIVTVSDPHPIAAGPEDPDEPVAVIDSDEPVNAS